MRMKIPIKGEPDFTAISDSELVKCGDVVQSLIFTYKYLSSEKTDILREILKDISNEHTKRLVDSFMEEDGDTNENKKITVRKIERKVLKKTGI